MLARLRRLLADMRYPCLNLALGCITLCLPMQAQVSSASLQGNITDSSNAAVGHAEVTVQNSATGAEIHLLSNDAGAFAAPSLQPGSYRLRIGKEGFAEVLVGNITLNVGDQRILQIRLRVSSAHESITVDAGGLTLNTTDASVSTVIDHKFVQAIPLNGRSFQDLISMTPGIVTQSPQSSTSTGNNGDFSTNGQRTESNYYTVDGVSANTNAGVATGAAQSATGGTIAASTALGTTQSLLSVDALQEFRVESSTYSAEYGRSPGGQFSFITRSGSNAFHGSAFDFLRNDYFDANDWFNDHYGKPISALRQNDFGGALGGPVVLPHIYDGRNGSFFFASYEGLRLTEPQAASIQYVPDLALRQNAPSELRATLNAYPLPSAGGVDSGVLAQFIQAYSLPSAINSTSVRLDRKLSDNLSLFVRYGYTPSSTAGRVLSSLQKSEANTQSATLGLTAQISSRLNNDFRLGYTRTDSVSNLKLDDFGGATPVNLGQTMGLNSGSGSYALFYLAIPGTGVSYLLAEDAKNRGRQWNLVDTANLSISRHQLKAGIDYRRILSPLSPPSPYAFAEFTSQTSILANASDYLSVQRSLPAYPLFNELALFAEDTWAVTSRLSLTLGLRWELNPPPSAASGLTAYTLLGSPADPKTLSLAPQGTSLWETSYYNFAPRLGGAYRLRTSPGSETILRTGGGVFFDTNNSSAAKGFSALGFTAYHNYYGASLPITPAQLDIPISVAPPYSSASIYAFPRHLQLPYTFQWNVSLEQAMGGKQSLTLSYVGSNGRRLQRQQSYSVSAVNPEFGYVSFFPSGVTSSYNALQGKYQRFVERGLQVLASYTWSHSLDFGSTSASLPLTRGNSDFDVRNNFQAGFTWDVPALGGSSPFAKVARGWSVDGRVIARTAFPITLQGNTLANAVSGFYSTNVDLVAGERIYLKGNSYPGGRVLNPKAFALPTGQSLGTAPRNFVRGFAANQLNLAAKRRFILVNELALEFRAEAFNVLNHPNFGYVDPMLTDATFGQATKMLNQSLGTTAAQYEQGGPRSMQFALRLAF